MLFAEYLIQGIYIVYMIEYKLLFKINILLSLYIFNSISS